MGNQHSNPAGVNGDLISSLSDNTRHAIALLVLFVLPVILFDSTILGDKRYMGHDTVQWRAGAESVIDYRQSSGEEALWANNMFSGMPAYVVSYEKAVYHLDNLLRDLFSSIFPAPFFWVLLSGAYLFFVVQGIRPLTATVGSILIGFTTYIPIIIGAGHNNKFIAYAFIPWILLGYWMITRSDKKWLSFFVFVTALILELRANHPQVTYYFIYLLGFWWLFDSWQAYKKNQLLQWGKRTGWITGALFLAIMANLQPYWSIYEYAPYTIRGGSELGGGSGLNLEYAFSWSQGPGELLTLIIPGIYGGASSEAYWGLKPGTSGPHYLGVITFIFAFIGVLLYKKPKKYLFLGVGVLTMLFSLGYNFSLLNEFMFNYVPYFDKFRTPEMWLIVTVVCFSILAVYGLHALIEKINSDNLKDIKRLFIPMGGALFIGIIFAFGSDALLSYSNPQERQRIAQQVAQQNNLSPDSPQVQQFTSQVINNRLKPERKQMAKSDSTRFLVIVIITCILIYLFYSGKISSGILLGALVILTAYDMLSIGNRYVNEQALVSENISPAAYIERQKGDVEEYIRKKIVSNESYPYRVFPLDRNPFNNASPSSYFYPSIGGYTGAKLSYYQDLIDELLFAGPRSLNMEILNMLNVKYVTYNQELPLEELKPVFESGGRIVHENTAVLPKAFFVDSVVTVGGAREAVEQLKPQNGFDASEFAVVETGDELVTRSDTTAGVTITNYDARRIEMEVNRSESGFLVISEIYYPEGWNAYIDGEKTTIYKTNYVLRGVQIPAGTHSVTLTFNPTSHIWGSRIAWFANILVWGLGVIVLIGYIRRSGKNRNGPSD